MLTKLASAALNDITHLAKAEKVHQTHEPTCLITANMSCAIYLCYFLLIKLMRNKIHKANKSLVEKTTKP